MAQVKRKRKVRVQTYAKLKKRLDAVFSLWTRVRFGLAFCHRIGEVRCVSCDVRKPVAEMQAGHFVSRSYLATRWHPENVAPQCVQCNIFKKGNLAAFAAWGVDRYGMDWPARMVSLSRVPTKFSRSDLEILIAEYEEKLKVLTGNSQQ